MASWKKWKRAILFRRQKGKCYYCKCDMVMPDPDSRKHGPRVCTIEHLDDRYSPERGKHYGEYRLVAACNECNNNRNREREKEVGIEVLREAAKRGLREKQEKRKQRALSSTGLEQRNSTSQVAGSSPAAFATTPPEPTP